MKNQLLRGTLILTAAGIITRLIGFVYRIFLADRLGDVELGIYQLVFPVYSICYTIYAAGIQTAVSQIVSHDTKKKQGSILKSGIVLSLFFSSTLFVLVFLFRQEIAVYLLGAKSAGKLLGVLSFIFPFCGVTAVINGFFYGINKAKIPALTQIIEQIARVCFVVLCCYLFSIQEQAAYFAVLGLVIGELFSNFYNLYHIRKHISFREFLHARLCIGKIFRLSAPLSSSKLVLALFGSAESILIPIVLQQHGYSKEISIGLYGILTGVVLPFILFPGTITNSLSVLLLPEIARASGTKDKKQIRYTASLSVKYSLLLGVVTSSLFLNYGTIIGKVLFHNMNAGKLLTVMAFLCPFIYVTTTLSSIINGLGKTGITFMFTIIGLVTRIVFLLLVVPHKGIYGYLFGMLISQILICLLHGCYLIKKEKMNFPITKYYVWPMIFCSCIMYLSKIAGTWWIKSTNSFSFLILTIVPAILVIFIYFLWFRLLSFRDFKVNKY